MAFLAVVLVGTTFAQQPELSLFPDELAKPPIRQPWWERAKQPLHPDLEKALADYTERLVPLRREDLSKHMTSMIATLVEKTGLADDEIKTALMDAAKQAVDEAMKPFAKAVTETNRVRLVPKQLPKTELTKEAVAELAAKIPRWPFEGVATNRQVLGCTLPEDQAPWTEALKQQLPVDQLAIWDKHMAAVRETKAKEIEDLLDPWVKSAHDRAEKIMTLQIEQLTRELTLDDARVEKLREASTETIARICRDERARAGEGLNFVTDERRANYIRRTKVFNTFTLDADPQRDRQWLDALPTIVPPQELAELARKKAAAKAKLAKDWIEFLAPSLDTFRDGAKKQMDQEINSLLIAISLPQERAKDLEAAEQGAIERAEKSWKKAALQKIETEDEETVRSRIESFKKSKRTYYFGFDNSKLLQNDPVWKEEMMKVFTPEERKTYELSQVDSKSRRERSMGMMLVAELDKRVAFTKAQREKMLPIAKRVVKGRSELFPNDKNNYRNYELKSFYEAAKKVQEEQLKPILDARQVANWKKALTDGPPKNRNSHRHIVAALKDRKVEKSSEPQRKPEPEALEHAISDYLYKKMKSERKPVLDELLLKADDAGRIAALPEETIARLETAARGATDTVINRMRANWNQTVRDHTRGATAQNIARRLAGINEYYYRNRGNSAGNESLWKNTIKAEMTEAQQAVWKKETDQRSEFNNRAVVAGVMAEFDRRYSINLAQRSKLEPKVAEIVKDYSEDINKYFSSSVWYLQSYTMLIPMAGVPEKDMKALLSKKQWDLWSKAHGQALNYWVNIKQQHDRRVKK